MTTQSNRARYEPAPVSDVDLDREDIRDRRGRRIRQQYMDKALADVYAKTGVTRNVTRTCGDQGNFSNSRLINCNQSSR